MADFVNDAKGEPLKRSGGANAAGYPQYTVWENVFEASGRNLAAGDSVSEFLTIPANTDVRGVYVEVLEGEASLTVNVGDAADPDGWAALADASAPAMLKGGGAYAAAGKLYTAETDLRFDVAGAAATVARFRVVAVGVNLG